MVKVLFDHQTFHIQRFGGISRYFCEIAGLMPDTEVHASVAFSMNQYLVHTGLARYVSVPMRMFKIFEGVFRKLNVRCSRKALRQGSFDVFHPTYYDPYFLDAIGDRPFVLTIHDMTHERYPHYFSPKDRTAHNKQLLAAKATRIIAISECTKRDIIEYLGVEESKIDVIYHGISPQPVIAERPASLPSRYMLYVGERRGYKNFEQTVEAFRQVRATHPDLSMVLTGRPLSKSEETMFAGFGITDAVKVFSDVSDAFLSQLYHNAALFVYPSLYEGFGIPILEAFAQDCPVVLSDASCFPEVAGDAARYFAPLSLQSMTDAINEVLDNATLRQNMVSKGRERLKLFTWETTARLTENVYKRCLKC